jgi:hypothetical protein
MQGIVIILRRVPLSVPVASLGGHTYSASLPPAWFRYALEGGRAQVDLSDRIPLSVQEYPNQSCVSFTTRLDTTSPNALGYPPNYNEKGLPTARLISATARFISAIARLISATASRLDRATTVLLVEAR